MTYRLRPVGRWSFSGYDQRPGIWLTAPQKLMRGIWPWTEGPRSRLPKHYKLRYIELHMKEAQPVNFRKIPDRFERKVENIPIPIKYPVIADEGLWGGEGVVEGLYRSKDRVTKARDVWMWKPELEKRLFHSEILDKWLEITVTRRALEQIDACQGLDSYILSTHEIDLKSKLGMKLKRQMLYALDTKDFHHEHREKQREVYNKYKHFCIPREEIEWLGLNIHEAEVMLLEREEDARLATIKPYKLDLMASLVQKLKENPDFGKPKPEEEEPTYSKLDPRRFFSGKSQEVKSA